MRTLLRFSGAIILTAIYLFTFNTNIAAQEQNPWSPPYQISGEGYIISSNNIVADQYGNTHLFWFESGFPDHRFILQYARFDGETLTPPVDIYVSQPDQPTGDLSAFIDNENILHLVWSEGFFGRAYYTRAPSHQTFRGAQAWEEKIRIDIPAREIKLKVDSEGVIHILFTSQNEGQEGVYYTRSENEGRTWSSTFLIDPDIPRDYIPTSLQFEIDEYDGLHAVWYYQSTIDVKGDFVRYVHSTNGGDDWSKPYSIDKDNERSGEKLSAAGPIMAVQGKNVHVIWGARDINIHRFHRLSRDGGLTWGPPVRIFGDLNGQAIDGLAVDGAGRVHFLGQIRYPQGIYHAYWDEERDRWVGPTLVYLIAWDHLDPIGDRIHAHFLRPVFRTGNQLIITFTPNTREALYIMLRTLDDISQTPIIQIPTSVPESTDTPTAPREFSTPIPIQTKSRENLFTSPSLKILSPGNAILMGVFPVLFLILGFVLLSMFKKRS